MLITFCFCSLFHVGGCHWLLCFAKANYHRALEVCAGGRLFFVIVDNEETGKALLERGQLRLGASVLRGGLILLLWISCTAWIETHEIMIHGKTPFDSSGSKVGLGMFAHL